MPVLMARRGTQLYRLHPDSPCRLCRWFRDGWCVKGVLDEYLDPLVAGRLCRTFLPRWEGEKNSERFGET